MRRRLCGAGSGGRARVCAGPARGAEAGGQRCHSGCRAAAVFRRGDRQAVVGIQGSEEKLIRAGQRGDPQAVETLFRRYQRPLFQTALRVLGNAEDAEDALQDGLLSAYRNLKRFEGRSQFSTWLTRIVINAALMKRRSAKARPAVSLDETHHEDELPRRLLCGHHGQNVHSTAELPRAAAQVGLIARSSTSKTSVELGGMPGRPATP